MGDNVSQLDCAQQFLNILDENKSGELISCGCRPRGYVRISQTKVFFPLKLCENAKFTLEPKWLPNRGSWGHPIILLQLPLETRVFCFR